jgi:hypothetical protein
MRHASRIAISLFLLLVAAPSLLWGQAATTGTVIGQVSDQTGAVVPGAQVTLTDVSTKSYQGQPTNSVGRFVFADIKPGTYDVSVTAKGFRKTTVSGQEVVVGQSLTLNLTLEVGTATQTVEVKAVAGAELQTLNSTMGATLGGDIVLALPNVNRDATSLLVFQPMTAPTFGGAEGNTTGGQVAGAMSDQNTFTLDGGNATDDLAGDNNYVAGNRTYVGPQAAIPTPVESIEEFKVSTNNQTADFSSSAGGQVMLVTKRGTNTFHGSVYDYFQANWLDAAGWNNNSAWGSHIVPVKQHQNRFGGAFGGPVLPTLWGGKTYFYANFEGRRWPYANGRYERTVPSMTLRQGIITLPDTNGRTGSDLQQYNLKTSTACGTTGGLPCDPRGVGIAPVIQNLWNKYEPVPNDCANPSYGDSWNTCGYFASLKLGIRDDFIVGRMDHDFGSKWRAYASYRWFSLSEPTTDQVDIGGLLPGDTLGVPASASNDPGNPRFGVLGLTGTLSPTVTNEFHVSMLRNDWNWQRAGVPTNLLGITGGMEVGGETGNSLDPLDMQTQQTRNRLWDGQSWTWSDTLSVLKSNHYFQMGGQFAHIHDTHARSDNITSSLTQMVYQINNGNNLVWGPNLEPMMCSATMTTGCLSSAYLGSYKGLVGEMAGVVATATQLIIRGGSNLAPTGGTELESHPIQDSYSMFFTDSWKIKPNLTLNYGIEWGVQMPPYEPTGFQDIFTDAQGNPLSINTIYNNMQSYSLRGQVYNPIVGFTPILGMGNKEKYPYLPWYGGFSPRVSLAYSPPVNSDNWLGKIFGNKKTVIRGGYVRIYDRTNSVNNVMTPMLGYGFGQPVRCTGMTNGGACLNNTNSTAFAATTLPSGQVLPAAWRAGVDGNTAPFPAIQSSLPIPAEPGINAPGASDLFMLNSEFRPGSDDQIDFSIQRELPGQMILEVGYNGRWAKHLYLGENSDNVPTMMTLGGQTYANAEYNLFRADQKGLTSVAAQPFFETALGGPSSAYCQGYASCSAAVLANEGINGTANISYYAPYSLFSDLDTAGSNGGGIWNFPGCSGCNILPSNLGHYGFTDDSTMNGFSNYQALFGTLQKRTGHGLVVSANFTYSQTLSTIGINQEYVEAAPNCPWNLHCDYGPAPFDRTLVMNILANYQLPFGKGKYFGTKNPVLDRIIGGWSFSPIYSWATGTPIESYTGSCQEMASGGISWCAGAVPLVDTGSFGHSRNLDLHTSGQTVTYQGQFTGSFVGSNNDPYKDCNGQTCHLNAYGANLFKNPAAVYNSYRPLLLGLDTTGRDYGPYRGQHRWNLDFTLAKQTHIKEKWNATFYAQFLNAFNHMEWGDPGLNMEDPGDFGTLTGQYNTPRVIELGLRIAF